MGSVTSVFLPRAPGDKAFFMKTLVDTGEPAQRRWESRRFVKGACGFRGGRGRWGRGPDPSGKLAGTFREGGRNLAGRFGDGSRTIRGRFEDDSRTIRGRPGGEARSDHGGDPGDGAQPGGGRARPVGTLAGSFREAGRILQGSWPEPSGTVRGRFEDGSRAFWRGKRGQTRPAARARRASRRTSAVGKPPLRAGRASISRRARPVGGLGRRTGRRSAGGGGAVPINGFRVKPFWGVHRNLARP